MAEMYHTIVLGLGAMGTAAAAALARRLVPLGEKVLGIEQFDIAHALGSSHGQSRLIRMAYYEHPAYVPLLRRSYALWRELEREAGCRVLHVTGGLYVGREEDGLIAGSRRSAEEHGLAHEMLTAGGVRARWPQFVVPAGQVGFFEEDAGFLLPEKAVAAQARVALSLGAELKAREAVLGWTADEGGVEVRTAAGVYRAKHLVITAGAWTGELVPALAEKIVVTRQVMTWFWPERVADFEVGRFPCWCAAVPEGGVVYGAPMLPGEPAPLGLKVSHHFPGKETLPGSVEREFLPGDAAVVRRALGALLPGANGAMLSHKVCLYSNSPDQHFMIDHLPGRKNVVVAAGFSGHGFKFAPVVGEILADLVTAGGTGLPAEFLRLGRLGV